MYLHNFYLILATVIATLHSCNASSDPIKRFETAVGQYDRKILEMSNANVVKKTHLLDTGKLTSVSKKLLTLGKAARPLILIVSIVFFQDIDKVR